MALLLRMGGVPARVATGFSPGGYSKRKQAWIVRDTDAHSWVEAWFDDYGWITLDPTPSDTPARSQIASIAAPATPEDSRRQPGGRPERRRRHPGRPARRRLARGAVQPAARRRRDGDRGRRRRGSLRAAAVAADPGRAGALRGRRAVVVARRRRARPDDPLERAIFELETALRRSGRPTPGGHDAAPARAPARPVRRGGGLPARGQRRALRAAAGATPTRRAAPGAAARARGRPGLRRPPAHVLGAAA